MRELMTSNTRRLLTAAGTLPAVAVAAYPPARKGAVQLGSAVYGVIRNPPMEWVDQDTGKVSEVDRFTRRQRWQITRPRWWYTLGAKKLGCGCTRRLGRFTLYSARCPKHSYVGALMTAGDEFRDNANWSDVLAVVERLTADTEPDEVAVRSDRGFLGYGTIEDTNGGTVRVYQSSAVYSGDVPGPFVWVAVDASPWLNAPDVAELSKANAHLTTEQAGRLVRALVRWQAQMEQEDADDDD
jgi:hypothetical protein